MQNPDTAQEVTPSTGQDTPDGASPDLAPPAASSVLVADPVDNSEAESAESEVPAVPFAETLPVVHPGDIGEGRIYLMQVLGVDVNRPFDGSIENLIRDRAPDYNGVVDAKIWEKLF